MGMKNLVAVNVWSTAEAVVAGDARTAAGIEQCLQDLCNRDEYIRQRLLTVLGDGAAGKVVVPVSGTEYSATKWNYSATDQLWYAGETGTGAFCIFNLDLPNGVIVTEMRVWVQGAAGHGGLPANLPVMTFYKTAAATGVVSVLKTETDASGNVGAYETRHSIEETPIAETIDNTAYFYTVILTNEAGANSVVGLEVNCLEVEYTSVVT
jgi:hypothetical protein